MLGGKSIALNAYIRKQEMSEIYDHFNKLEKEKQNTWGKKIIKNRNKRERKDKWRKLAMLFLKRDTNR